MKISILAIVTSILVVVDTATLNNENPTIWVRDTVRVLRSQTQNLYTSNLGLYQNIHIFDDGSHDCVSPVPAGHYWKYNTCPNGNKLASEAMISVATAWNVLATTMFPVYYNLTDTKDQPRATFSDFSHFYNHLLLEIQSLQNTVSYYICRANIRQYSDFWNATAKSHFDNNDYANTRFGPPVFYIGNAPIGAGNGTDGAYPYDGPFTKSIRKNSGLEQDGWSDLSTEMLHPGAEFPRNVCKRFVYGLPAPRPPATFP